ncbi:MAG TPA: HNH endonuclease [Azospira sp.]|nr:HNH endonuclease [Azospira sp.]
MIYGFSKLDVEPWADDDKKKIEKLFNGGSKDWSKKSLKSVRDRLREYLLQQQSYRCAYCRREIREEIGRNEIDHIIPKDAEGMARFTYERANLIATCKRCNWRKHAYNPVNRALGPDHPYPLKPDDFIWIHPYIHKYEEHITIHNELTFEAIGSKKHRARALAVIKTCHLGDILSAERRARLRKIKAVTDTGDALLTAIGLYPNMSPNRIARMLVNKDPKFVNVNVAALASEIDLFRNEQSSFKARIRALAHT